MRKLTSFAAACILLWACSGGDNEPTTPPVNPPVGETHIPINLSVTQAGMDTRATDTSFETSDKIGLYVVNYANGVATALQATGNHVNNMRLTYSNSTWTPDTQLFWKDEATKADFYCYYPYASVTNVQNHSFTLNDDQSVLANYKAGDFLWGKTSGASPTTAAVSVLMKHVFSNVIIIVEPGEGFNAEQLAAATIRVKLGAVKTAAEINLTTGVATATATGTSRAITPLKEDGTYRALVVPQTVSADDFITVTVNDKDYVMPKSFTFVANKKHTFTVKVTRTSSGVNVGIDSWDTDDTDHGGVAE